MILSVVLIALSSAFAGNPSQDLQELKKLDYSILLREPMAAKEDLEERCFLLPQVNNALSRVQQRMRVLQSGIRVSRCYEPGDARYGKGAAVAVGLSKEGRASQKLLIASMRSEGFREAGKGKGIFVHEASEATIIRKTPISELP